MRAGRVVLTVAVAVAVVGAPGAGCGGAGVSPTAQLCVGDNADPNACLAVAIDHHERKREDQAREYMEKLVLATNSAPACLRDHDARGCFAGVVALLRDQPVGLLAPYAIPEALLVLVPRWTGSDATGPRMQARAALVTMCTVAGRDPIAQQRACIVLGDLVADERMRRCGPDCDPTNKGALGGWSTADVIDGYARACKIDHSKVPADVYAVFADDVTKTYLVAGANPVCAVDSSARRGASIPGAIATMERIKSDIRARAASSESAAKRETERLAAMEKSKLEAAKRAQAAEDAAFQVAILDAIHRSDWAVTFGMLTRRRGSPISAEVATAINTILEPFLAWAATQTSLPAAYLDLASRLALAPKSHPIRVSMATLRDLALIEAKKTAKKARGVGGAWLHAALVARIAGPTGPDEAKAAATAWTRLVASARTTLQLESLSPACAPLIRPSTPGGKAVKAKSTLQCTIEPEKKFVAKEPFKVKQHVVDAEGERDVEVETLIDVNHRTFKVAVHGVLAIYAGAPRRAVPIDFEEAIDDVDGSDTRKFDASVASARDLITQATVVALEAATADAAYKAGLLAAKNNRKEAAENQLVIHGILAGSSPELDELMIGYGATFAELLPQ